MLSMSTYGAYGRIKRDRTIVSTFNKTLTKSVRSRSKPTIRYRSSWEARARSNRAAISTWERWHLFACGLCRLISTRALARRKTSVWIYITSGCEPRVYGQESRKDDKPLILPIEAWCLDWTRSFPYPFHVITAGTEATLLPAGNCDNLSAKGGRCRRRAGGKGAGAKIGGRISTSLRSDQPDLFLLYLPSPGSSFAPPPSPPPFPPPLPKTNTVAVV